MPRHNHTSLKVRKRIARELALRDEELSHLERELHAQWAEQTRNEQRDGVGDGRTSAEHINDHFLLSLT